MKPVNLTPGDAQVVVASSGKPNLGMIGGAVAGVVLIAGVAAYFAMARVDTVKSETLAAQTATTAAQQETAEVRAKIDSLGQPVVDSDKQLAQGQEQIVVAAYTERYDFVQLSQELRGIMQGTGGWYHKVDATSANQTGVRQVMIEGYMPTKELAASFNERINGTRTMSNAEIEELKTERLADKKTKKIAPYWRFKIGADLIDTKAPFADGGSGGSGDGTGTTVADPAAGSSDLTLSLEPKPKPKPTKPKEPAKPKNPFDVAATAARGGGS